MSYNIEILAVNERLYEQVEKAFASLNQVQSEFVFNLPSSRLRERPYLLEASEYQTNELFEWLKEYRKTAGGNRPFLILVVDGFLKSTKTENLFAGSSPSEGLAVFTVDGFDQFFNDIVRFCRYYLTNSTIRFFEPSIRSHKETRACLFDYKERKRDLLLSLDSGRLCDDCSVTVRGSQSFNLDIKNAITKLLQIVSNQHPYSIVMKGGGVKGLALAGALLELEKHFSFDTFVGTSAGAIAAVLLGAGYKPSELLDRLRKKDFNDFRDASVVEKFKNFRDYDWLYPGYEIKRWIKKLLEDKIQQESTIEMRHLPWHTIVYASREKQATMPFDSKGDRQTTHAHFAARCSMGIPFYFRPEKIDDDEIYDGGIANNFPLQVFIDSNRAKPFIGLYLKCISKKPGIFRKIFNIATESLGIDGLLEQASRLASIAIDGDESALVDKYKDKMVVIDVHTIQTTDFNLSDRKKEFLETAGRIAALNFLEKYHPSIKIDENYLSTLAERYDALKLQI